MLISRNPLNPLCTDCTPSSPSRADLPTPYHWTDLVKKDSIMKVLEQRIPSGFLEMNRQALELGLEMGKNAN